MRNIDIIKAAQHVDDKFVNEAIDLVPIQKHSFKWGYAAAAACAAVAIAVVPVIAKYRSSYSPGNSKTSSASGSWDASPSYSGESPIVADTKLANDTPRTFYNVITGESAKKPGRVDFGLVNLTDELTECLSKPHDPRDLFAVSVSEHNDADLQRIYDDFARPYDKNEWFLDTLGSGALFMTEEEIKALYQNKTASSGLTILLDLAPADYRAEEIDEGSLKNERYGKVYAEIQLDKNYDKLASESDVPRAGEVYGGGQEVGYPEIRKLVEQYIIDFANDYGINAQLLYAGEIDSYNGKLCGEFDVETVNRMLGDKRISSISKSNGGGYVYENYGVFLSEVKVTEKQMEKLPAGLTYREIFDRLGNTAAFGHLKTRYYVTENAGLIILNFDSVNDVCTLSGKELYDSAVPLYYDYAERPDTADPDMQFGVIGKSGLFITLNGSGHLNAGYGHQSPEGCEIIHEDGTPAEKEELDQIGRHVFYKAGYQLESAPPQYQCTKIVILDD